MSAIYPQLYWDDVVEGQEVTPIALPASYSMVLLSAIATMDFFPGHHNPDYAKGQGQVGIYVNTMTYQGLIDRVVANWAGPQTFVTRRKITMQRSVCAGDTITGTGKVTRLHLDANGRGLVDLKIDISSQNGLCCPGVVTAALPRKPA